MPSRFYNSYLIIAACCWVLVISSCSKGKDSSDPVESVDFHLNLELVEEIDEFPHQTQPFYFPEITAIRSYGETDFLVTDNWLKQILHLDRDGQIIRDIGREGRGPGEFTNL